MKKIVMLIDDEVDFCYFLKKNLELTGEFEVVTSYDGEDGIRKIKLHRPDVILLDIMMPGLSGPDVAAELKNDESTRNIPVVFSTAIIQEQEVKQSQNVIGGWHYIAKPIEMDKLLALLRQLTKERA